MGGPIAIFAAELALVCAGVAALALWLRRRFRTSWRTWWWGALAFIASQVARIPLLIVFGALAAEAPSAVQFAVLVISSGVFEETSRWLVLRYGARDARRWRDGVMLGAGHGGTEAIIVIGGAAVGAIILLTAGDQLLDSIRATAPEQAAAFADQLEAVRSVTAEQAALALYERVLAIVFHIAASLLVLRSIQERAWRWLLVAVVFHALFNTVALVVAQRVGVVTSEAALTLFSILSVAVIVRERRGDDALSAPADEGTPG